MRTWRAFSRLIEGSGHMAAWGLGLSVAQSLTLVPIARRSLAMLSWFWERCRAQAILERRRPTLRGFVAYLQAFWGLERASGVPAFTLRRLLRRRATRSLDQTKAKHGRP